MNFEIPEQTEFTNLKGNPRFTEKALDYLALQVLEYYKDGEYQEVEEGPQPAVHRQYKKIVKDAFKKYQEDGNPKPILKFLNPIFNVLAECNLPETVKLKGDLRYTKKQNKELVNKIDLMKNGHELGSRGICQICMNKIDEMVKMKLEEIEQDNDIKTIKQQLTEETKRANLLLKRMNDDSYKWREMEDECNELRSTIENLEVNIQAKDLEIKKLKKNGPPTKKKKKKKKVVYVTDSESDSE